jgi:hypothetical protein
MVPTGDAHPRNGILARAAVQTLGTIQPHILFFFLRKEDIRQIRPVLVVGVVRPHLLVDLIRGIEPFFTEVVGYRARYWAFFDLIRYSQ